MNSKPVTQGVPAPHGVVNTVKSNITHGAQWLGRQVIAAKDAVIAVVAKVVAYVKPFFAGLSRHVSSVFECTKTWIRANRDVIAPVSLILTAIGTGVGVYYTFFHDEANAQAQGSKKALA